MVIARKAKQKVQDVTDEVSTTFKNNTRLDLHYQGNIKYISKIVTSTGDNTHTE